MIKIKNYIKNCAQVKIIYSNEEIYAQIIKCSKQFLYVRDIKDWHYDSYMILNMDYIEKIYYRRIEKFRQKLVLPSLHNLCEDIKLNSWFDILTYLKHNYPDICIDLNNNDFLIGRIKKVKKEYIEINELDMYGKFKKNIKIYLTDLKTIYFDDEYSKVLFSYNKSYNSK